MKGILTNAIENTSKRAPVAVILIVLRSICLELGEIRVKNWSTSAFDARGRRRAASHLVLFAHNYTQACETHTSGVGWVSRGGKGAGEFVIVIARRGRAAIAITPRRRSYRPAGLLASATRTYVPTYLRSYSPTPPTPFRPTDSYFRAT